MLKNHNFPFKMNLQIFAVLQTLEQAQQVIVEQGDTIQALTTERDTLQQTLTERDGRVAELEEYNRKLFLRVTTEEKEEDKEVDTPVDIVTFAEGIANQF